MTVCLILRGDDAKNRAVWSTLQIVALCQQIFRNHLQADFDVLDVRASRNIRIAFGAGVREHQAPWLYFAPELLVVHRGQPLFNIISGFEHFHAGIVAKLVGALQISSGGCGYGN